MGLTIGRKEGQKIVVNDDLVIEIVHIDNRYGCVKISFEGDKDKYTIDRYEIHLKKQAERGI